jgi:hypothetical protein
MPQLTAQQIADILFQKPDRVTAHLSNEAKPSLTAAFNELKEIGFKEDLLSRYRYALSKLTDPDNWRASHLTIRYAIHTNSAAILSFPREIVEDKDAVLGVRFDGQEIAPDSMLGKMLAFDLVEGLIEAPPEFRGPRVDPRKLTPQ